MAKQETANCIIGEGATFEGSFNVPGSIEINGKFNGEMKTDGQLTIGTTGKVKTSTLYANVVNISGTLIGNIDAKEEVNLLETGRVLGDIKTPKLRVSDGVVTEGQIVITGGQQKDIQRVIEESFGEKIDDLGGEKPQENNE